MKGCFSSSSGQQDYDSRLGFCKRSVHASRSSGPLTISTDFCACAQHSDYHQNPLNVSTVAEEVHPHNFLKSCLDAELHEFSRRLHMSYACITAVHADVHSLQGREGGHECNALDVHAQRLGVVAAGSSAAVHPLEEVLESLTYQDWQLEAPEPLVPQVNSVSLTYRRVIDV